VIIIFRRKDKQYKTIDTEKINIKPDVKLDKHRIKLKKSLSGNIDSFKESRFYLKNIFRQMMIIM
jgi:hypothetical protein